MMKNFLKKTAAIVLSGTMLLGGLSAAPNLKSFMELPAIVASAYTTQRITNGYAVYTYREVGSSQAILTRIDLNNSTPSNYTLNLPAKLNNRQIIGLEWEAFQDNANKIKYLVLPDSVKNIGCRVFKNCTSLDTLTLSENLEKVDSSCFSNVYDAGTLKHLKLRRSNGTVFNVTRPYIDNVASATTFVTDTVADEFKINSGNDALVSLLLASSGTEFGQQMCREKAIKIRTIYTQNSMTSIQKMQALYNYVVTHTRYGKVHAKCFYWNGLDYGTGEDILNRMDQSAMGVLFFNIGVCSGYAKAMKYLGDSAGLDIKVVSKGGHAWNLFLPSGSSKYYVVDGVWGECGTGYQYARYQYAKERLQYAEDGTTCQVSPYMMGSTRQFEVRNDKKNSNFNISLVDSNAQSKSYFSYNTYSLNDQGTLHCCDLVKPTDEFLFADLTASFDLQIRDENGYLLYTVGNLLGDLPRYCLFYDKQGQVHTVHISLNTENSDQNQRTSQKCRYVIRFDL